MRWKIFGAASAALMLALEAAEEHLSLNQYVVRRLGDAS